MYHAAFLVGWLGLMALIAAGWRSVARRERAWQRLSGEGTAESMRSDNQTRLAGRLSRRWMWVPWLLGVCAAGGLWLLLGASLPYLVAVGVMVALLGSQLESFFAGQQAAKLEHQLADAIDMMVGAVGAGASVGSAIEAAITESRAPLRPYLEEISGRIRLGDEPAEVFRTLAVKVPLETFLLFASALTVHWEVGGRLAPTLTTVGRTIRDRIEISRRIRSNIAQSQFSTIAIVGLVYFIALIVWRNGPEQMEEFATSTIGSWFVAGSIVMQAMGIIWMNLISKARF